MQPVRLDDEEDRYPLEPVNHNQRRGEGNRLHPRPKPSAAANTVVGAYAARLREVRCGSCPVKSRRVAPACGPDPGRPVLLAVRPRGRDLRPGGSSTTWRKASTETPGEVSTINGKPVEQRITEILAELVPHSARFVSHRELAGQLGCAYAVARYCASYERVVGALRVLGRDLELVRAPARGLAGPGDGVGCRVGRGWAR